MQQKYQIKPKLALLIAAITALLGGICIYTFYRNTDNMVIFKFIPKPSFMNIVYTPLQTDSIWVCIFIYNLPSGLWCLSGLFLIRAIWLHNAKWGLIYRSIFIALTMFYVVLKLPGIIPGTFDILDLVLMGFFAFLESIIFYMFIRRNLW